MGRWCLWFTSTETEMAVLAFAPAYLVPLLATLVSIYAFTRILTPEQYGTYAFLVSVMLLCEGALFAWIGLGTKRFYERAQGQGKLPVLCGTIYLALGTSAVLLILACAVTLELIAVQPPLKALLWISTAVIIVRQVSLLSKSLELAALSRLRYVLMECGESLIGVGCGLYLCWRMHFAADGILYGMLAGAAAVVLFDARQIVQRLRRGRFDSHLQREIINFAMPITVALIVEYVVSSADRLMIQFFLGADQLGIYAVGYGIADRAVGAVFLALAVGSYPLVVRAFERDGQRAAQLQARQNIELMMAAVLPALGGFTIASGHIAAVLVGPAYAQGAAALMPLSGVAVFMYGLRSYYFAHAPHLANNTWALLAASAPAAVINLGLNIVLLPSIGLMGAVWARLVAYTVALAISIFLARRMFPLPFPGWEATKALLATCVMSVVLYWLDFPKTFLGLSSMIVIGGSLYLALAYCLNIVGLRHQLFLVLKRYRPAVS
jgi:O-antigen/teichoic acid export membrane protein